MPRGRPKKQVATEPETNGTQQQQQEYTAAFARAMASAAQNPSLFMNPFLQNDILKNTNMSPVQYDRDAVEKLIKNPRQNEAALRSLAQYLENYVMHFKRLIYHYGCILTFDNYLEPTNADEEDYKTPAFKKSRKKAVDWLDGFNVKKTFTEVLRRVVLEDAVFYYVRESEVGISLQEMPSQWVKIIRKTDYGYQYSFNMMYFTQTGVNLDDYAPEFRDYYNTLLQYKDTNEKKPLPSGVTTEHANNQYMFWQELDPVKAPCFKFDENRAGIVPPLMGLFVDTTEIATYKDLLKTKTKLEVWKILLSKIPLHNDGKSEKKNNFAIDATEAAKFNALIQGAIPEGTKSIVTPFETEAVDFKNSENKNDIAGIGEDMFYRSAGTPAYLFGESKTTGTGIIASIATDEAFIKHVYFSFERFINIQLKRVSGKFRFKCHLEGTIHDDEDRFTKALQAAQVGAPKTYLATAMGKTLDEFVNLLNYENSIGLVDKMVPLQSSHTQTDQGGAPKKAGSKITDAGQKTRDGDGNMR